MLYYVYFWFDICNRVYFISWEFDIDGEFEYGSISNVSFTSFAYEFNIDAKDTFELVYMPLKRLENCFQMPKNANETVNDT